jgi:hypothetical protein
MTQVSDRPLRAEILQWFGLFGAFLVWVVQFVLGWGVSEARCGAVNFAWHVPYDAWQIGLMAVGVPIALAAELAAIAVFRETRDVEHDDGPPWGRRHFFAAAAIVGNVLFVLMILLSGLAAIYHGPCRAA